MVNLYSSLNTLNYTPPNYGTTPIYTTITSAIAPKIEENNPEELKINVKKHQIKFNFVL